MDVHLSIAIQLLHDEALATEEARSYFLLEGDADAHALGRAQERVLLANKALAIVAQVQRNDLAGIGCGEPHRAAHAGQVGISRHEETFTGEHALARAPQLVQEALFLPIAITEDGLHLDAFVHHHHGAGFGQYGLLRVEGDLNALHVVADNAVVQFVCGAGHGLNVENGDEGFGSCESTVRSGAKATGVEERERCRPPSNLAAHVDHPLPVLKTAAKKNDTIDRTTLLKAWELMCTAKAMTEIYEEHFKFTSKYVHATSRGHEAIQLALGLQLKPQDFVSPYYRDDSILLGIGMRPYDLMLQLMAKRDDPFSGGRSYYCHPSLKRDDMPRIPHQSSATGMQAIPTTGIALGLQYKELAGIPHDHWGSLLDSARSDKAFEAPIVVCSIGDAAITEGEVAEAFQMAVLKKLPIIYLVQDNEWDISASAEEVRAGDASDYAKGFKGLEVRTIDGTDFFASYNTLQEVIALVRSERRPFLVHAKVPLLNHHTSGVRMDFYRSAEDLAEHRKRDPFPRFFQQLLEHGIKQEGLKELEKKAIATVKVDFDLARNAEDPRPEDLFTHDFAPTPITEEKGEREPKDREPTVMVDCALFAIRELMQEDDRCLLYGQDVGARLGGVFREAATLAKDFGDHRVFNTPIQEAFIIGSTVGMSAAGLKPIVEVQFADYIWPGLNQLFTEVARSCYLTVGKYPVSCIIRVPIGAYGSGGPYHSSSVESVLCNIKGIKIAYPSTGADLKGLMKAAYHDPNPVVMLEHKGLYWSKIKGTEDAKSIEPSPDYIVPFGKARIVQQADANAITNGEAAVVVTYGMGVYWAKAAAKEFGGRITIIDLRTLVPLDEETVMSAVNTHGRCLVVTEEQLTNSFAQALASRIGNECFEKLDAPVRTLGAVDMPAVPLNSTLEAAMIPSAEKVAAALGQLLAY